MAYHLHGYKKIKRHRRAQRLPASYPGANAIVQNSQWHKPFETIDKVGAENGYGGAFNHFFGMQQRTKTGDEHERTKDK
jgi:hypothetical protein